MKEDFETLIRKKGKCCITEKPLTKSKHINMVQMHIPAKWDYPVWGNFITGEEHMAVAYVHDDSIIDGNLSGPVKFVVEFQGAEIIYHAIPRCRVCGCSDDDCRQCIQKTGSPCHWVEEDLCSACQGPIQQIK